MTCITIKTTSLKHTDRNTFTELFQVCDQKSNEFHHCTTNTRVKTRVRQQIVVLSWESVPHEMSWTSYQSGQDLNLWSLYSSQSSTQVLPLHFCQAHWLVHLNIPTLYSIGRSTCKMVLNLVSMHTTWKSPPYTADTSLSISLDSAVSKVTMLQTEHLGNHRLISSRENQFFL